MLSLLILFMLFGTLLPMMQKMHQTLGDKQLRATAFETLHEAAKAVKAYGVESGERTVDQVVYNWYYGDRLCVEYENHHSMKQTICLE